MSLVRELLEAFEGHVGHLQFYGPNCPFRGQLNELLESSTDKNWAYQCHFMGHLIDGIAGEREQSASGERQSRVLISQLGIERELRYIYNDLNNPEINELRRTGISVEQEEADRFQVHTPELIGCLGWEADAELMAEAIRAYLQNPNYIKTVAPGVARRIRDFVNPNPRIHDIIQFN